MRINSIQFCDTANGDGICVTLWIQGCHFHCPGCHNKELWDFNGGIEMPGNKIIKTIVEELTRGEEYYSGFCILGGEPLCEENRQFIWSALSDIRQLFPKLKIWLWTGYTFEELQELNDPTITAILNTIDVLVDGRYEEDKRELSRYYGSSNQRVIFLEEYKNNNKQLREV